MEKNTKQQHRREHGSLLAGPEKRLLVWMAEHLPDNGEIVTLDINPNFVEIAKPFWERSPHGTKIKSIIGHAKEVTRP